MKVIAFLIGLTASKFGRNNILNDGHGCPYAESFDTIDEYMLRHPNADPKHILAVSGTKVPLTDAHNNLGAACLDGSVPNIYWRPGTGDGVNKFHVFFQGGGWCAGIENQVSQCDDTCPQRATTDLGTSKNDGASLNYDDGYMSTSQSVNPLTYNW
eukprot:CAMPEP_0114660988 /NCGR_PEP_ID=MMETSP0191-20121206/21406_1 /TAXON_ID=126664 /ORGANISM="Sorites sp." /LENGTH=155 /DNA_ID=CAMNT_0001891777 /DNA_START=27 /DNA_END=491 /DNA_ORIENTATION=-